MATPSLATPGLATRFHRAPDFDAEGFMLDMDHWDEATARWIAALDGLGELDEHQMALARLLRQHYLRLGAPPALAHICRQSGLAGDCLNQLFPSAREAWRIAGLPDPGEEAKAYL